MIIDLINNIALIAALGVGFELVSRRLERRPILYGLTAGLIFGAVGVAGMMAPLHFSPGVIYDARSIVLSLAGLFGGPLAAVLSALICGAYRLYLGGAGAIAGTGVVIEAAALGTVLYYLRRRDDVWVEPLRLWLFGLLVHAIMLVLQLLIPKVGWDVMARIGPAVLFFYPLGFLLIAQVFLDGDRRRKAEQALRESEENLREAQEIARIGRWELDLVKNQLQWSKEIFELFEISEGSLPMSFQTFLDIIHPDDRAVVERAYLDSVENKKTYEMAHRLLMKDGRVKWVNEICRTEYDNAGRPLRSVGTVQDITDRKRVEEELRKNEEFLRILIESSPVGIIALRAGDGKTLYMNQRFVELFGYSLEDLPDIHRWWPLAYPDEPYREKIRSEWTTRTKQAEEMGEKSYVVPLDAVVRCKDGTRHHVQVNNSIIVDKRLLFFTDLTDQKRAEEKIRQLNVELEKRVADRTAKLQATNQELEAFTYSVAHDLRAPLRAINGFSQIVLEDYAPSLDPEGVRLLNLVRSNTQKMDSLIMDLLGLSRITRTELQVSRIEMTQLVHSVWEETFSAEVRGKFTFEVAPLPESDGDPGLIRQVWVNLLSNAVKYTLPREERRIEVGSDVEGDMQVYYVKDNGVGFDPQFTQKLFGVFQRLHRAEEFEGTGIGLAIVQRIIHRHGGRVWARGQVDQGATFYFSLPENRSRSRRG